MNKFQSFLLFNCGVYHFHFKSIILQLHHPSWSLGKDGDWYLRGVTILRYFNTPNKEIGFGVVILGFGAAIIRKL